MIPAKIPQSLHEDLMAVRDLWKKSPKEAYTFYDSLLLHYPEHPAVLREYGKALTHEYEEFAKAISLFERAVEADPKSFLSWRYLAELYATGYGKGYSEVPVVYHYIIEHFPDLRQACVEAWLQIGTLYQTPDVIMSMSEAIEAIHQAIKLDPASAEAYECLALVLYDTGDWQGTCDALLSAIQWYQKRGKPVDHLIERLQLLKRKESWNFGSFPLPLISLDWPKGEIEE